MFENPKAINDVFFAQYGEGASLSRAERMNIRNDIARRLVKASPEQAQELERSAKANHERELREWNVELDNIDEAEDVIQYVSACSPSVDYP